MKKANKALAALLALTMVTGSLAGCGSSNGSGKTETAPATESTTETADAGASASGADTLVASSAHFEGKFSPFFAASAEDQHIVDMTQIPRLPHRGGNQGRHLYRYRHEGNPGPQ